MRKKKTVAIVENQKHQREALQMMLERLGLRAFGAATVAEAYKLIEELGDGLDVMALDMSLADPEARNVTGADIAIRMRDLHPDWTPERLIITAYPTAVNYRLALRLGVAAFLSKDEAVLEDFVRHIRVLALKRSLRADRPQVMLTLASVSASAKTLSGAVDKFCREMLAEELDACLGAPYLLLLTDEGGAQNVATNTDIPTGYLPLYEDVQAVAHGITKFDTPYVTWEHDADNPPSGATEAERRAMARLEGAALLPLASVRDFRLTLALFNVRPGESDYAEDAGQLAAVLARHVRPSIIEHFLSILIQLDTQKRAMLKSISYLCHYIGHEQQRIVEGGVTLGHLREESGTLRSLRLMADDLRQTGAVLSSAADGPRKGALTTLEMRSLIDQEFRSLRGLPDMNLEALHLRAEGNCRVRAGEDLGIAVKCVLQWLTQRHTQTPSGVAAGITVLCAEREDGSSVTFEDRSRRLPREVREHLFEPFSTSLTLLAGAGRGGPGVYLPLYLSKVIVEEKYGGRLEDESDGMEGEVGHRLVMRFDPPGQEEVAGGAAVVP
jgi:DNA-binding NarL/FixJ family response regulator